MNEPMRDEEPAKSFDKIEIVMGYTAERPSPAAEALATTPGNW